MDAFDKPYWNTMQVLAWVYLGDRAAVAEVANDAKRTILREVTLPDGRNEWIDQDIGPHEQFWLAVKATSNGGAALPNLKTAKTVILDELIAGRLTCSALRNNEGDPEEIPCLHWPELQFYWDHSDKAYAGPKSLFRQNATHWHELRFRREQVLSIWPDPLASMNTEQAVSPDYWLSYDRLDLGTIINIARDASPTADWPPPPDGIWHARFRALKAIIDSRELPATLRQTHANALAVVRLTDACEFTRSHIGKEWDWLREFCRRWAALRADDLVTQPSDPFDAVLSWVHAGTLGAAPVEIPSTPWIPLTDAELLVLAYGKIEIETQVRDGTLWLTDASWRALSVFLGNVASVSLRLRGRPQQPGKLGDMQDIPAAYFNKERAFRGDGTIGRLPHRTTSAVVSEIRALKNAEGRENDWVEVQVSWDDLSPLLSFVPKPQSVTIRSAGAFSEAKLIEWYTKRVDTWPKDRQPPSRDEDWTDAKEALGDGVPRDAVWDLRRGLAPGHWTEKGRRKTVEKKSGDQ